MKKTLQLGMNPSTASGRLVKDILFSLVVKTGQNSCFQCGEPMDRESFSVEHKKPWLDSEDPVGLFFNLSNISFSHKRCNSEAARKVMAPCGTESAYRRGCRCTDCGKANLKRQADAYTPEKRRARYKLTGR